MATLPHIIVTILSPFFTIFSTQKTFSKAILLFSGALLCRGGRTVCGILKVLGMKGEKTFNRYHHVLSRATWSPLKGSKILLHQLEPTDGKEPIIIGMDGHLERRRGRKISQKGCYRDPVRSSRKYVVKSYGIKWLSMMVLKRLPSSKRTFALPFFTALLPSKKANETRGKQHKTIVDWARQMIIQVRKWIPNRSIIFVADGEFATAFLAWTCLKYQVSLITRLRMDARFFNFPAPYSGRGRPAKKGKRLMSPQQILQEKNLPWQSISIRWYGGLSKTVNVLTNTCLWHVEGHDPVPIRWLLITDPGGRFSPVILMSTDVKLSISIIIETFVDRWGIEVTFRESRELLGVETQRQWSDLAIARTTPMLFALYSFVVLMASNIGGQIQVSTSIWYKKKSVTFSDLLVHVRRHLLKESYFHGFENIRETSESHGPPEWDFLMELLSQVA